MKHIEVPAIEFTQGLNRKLYAFVIDTKQIPQFASIARLKRNDGLELFGYQRPEILTHINEIVRYLESNNPMIPNALVVAFDPVVQFRSQAANQDGDPKLGFLRIPLSNTSNQKVAWIVDGQQRIAAVRNSRIESFSMCVVGFVAENENAQREQFILVNSAKPLPKDLIDELIPETTEPLGSARDKKKSLLVLRNTLNFDKDSPFAGRIKTPTVPQGYISSASVLKMVENSITNGALFHFRSSGSENPGQDALVLVLKRFWSAVAETFPDAWSKPPTKSRLTHGAGIISMGFIMDSVCSRFSSPDAISVEDFCKELKLLIPTCRWTDGEWDFGGNYRRKWNEIQNISKDIELLANHLVTRYHQLRGNQKPD